MREDMPICTGWKERAIELDFRDLLHVLLYLTCLQTVFIVSFVLAPKKKKLKKKLV